MKYVNAMKATTKSSFENFQMELPFKEFMLLWYLKKNSI